MADVFARRPSRQVLTATAAWTAEAGRLRLADLAGPDGRALPRAVPLLGTRVALRGYLAPTAKAQAFLLTEDCIAACQLCGGLHSGNASAGVEAVDQVLRTITMLQPAEVTGELGLAGSCDGFHAPELVLRNATGKML